MTSNFIYPQLFEILQELISKKENGVLFIRSDCNHSINFAFANGQIQALNFGPRRGDRAISLIRDISGGSYRFDYTALVDNRQDLPPTDEIVSLLKLTSATAGVVLPAETQSAGDGFTKEARLLFDQEIKTLLTDYLGPISEVIFDETLEEIGGVFTTGQQAEVLIDKLSIDIEAPQTRQFKEKAGIILKNTLPPASS